MYTHVSKCKNNKIKWRKKDVFYSAGAEAQGLCMLSKHSTTEIHSHPLVFYGKIFKFCSLVYFEPYVIVDNIYLSLWYISKLSPPPYIEIFTLWSTIPYSLTPSPPSTNAWKEDWMANFMCIFPQEQVTQLGDRALASHVQVSRFNPQNCPPKSAYNFITLNCTK
jgi:hypothetical protein